MLVVYLKVSANSPGHSTMIVRTNMMSSSIWASIAPLVPPPSRTSRTWLLSSSIARLFDSSMARLQILSYSSNMISLIGFLAERNETMLSITHFSLLWFEGTKTVEKCAIPSVILKKVSTEMSNNRVSCWLTLWRLWVWAKILGPGENFGFRRKFWVWAKILGWGEKFWFGWKC